MEDSGAASVYGEAKGEYTKQLCVFLLNPLQRWFLNLFEIAKTEELDKRKVLKHYQDLLSQIPDWNVDKVSRETAKISEESGCDYLEDLLTAVFIAHTKVLSAIRIGSSRNKSIQITVPKLEHFLHRCLSESARRVWSNVYLFADGVSSLEKQKNLRQLESILNECIQQAVRGLLPVKNLLRDYLTETTGPEEEDSTIPSAPPKEEVTQQTTESVTSAEPPVIKTLLTPESAAPAPAPAPPAPPEPIETLPELVSDVPIAPTPVESATTTTPEIIVETEQARVHFSDYNTVFKDGESHIVPTSTGDESDDDEDSELPLKIYEHTENLSFDDFEQVDSRPPSPMEFEVLN